MNPRKGEDLNKSSSKECIGKEEKINRVFEHLLCARLCAIGTHALHAVSPRPAHLVLATILREVPPQSKAQETGFGEEKCCGRCFPDPFFAASQQNPHFLKYNNMPG